MFASMKDYLTSPAFSDDQFSTHFSRAFKTLLLNMMLVLVLAGLATAFIFVRKQYSAIQLLLYFLMLLTSWGVAQRGRIRLASVLFVAGNWVIFTAVIFLAGGINTINLIFYVSVTVTAGALLGPRAAVLVAVLSVAAGLGKTALDAMGYVAPLYALMPATSAWFLLVFGLVLAVTPLNLVLRSFAEALAHARQELEERRRIETMLRESEERYHELFENANDIVYTHDREGNLTSLNKAGQRSSGFTLEEALKQNVLSIVAARYQPLAREMVDRKMAGADSTVYEVAFVAKDGREVPVEVSTRVIHRDGVPVGIQGIARDITERLTAEAEHRRLEAQVQHMQKLEGLGVLAGGIAHDFNNLLVGLLGYAGLALTKLSRESPARAYVEKIEETAKRAAELTNQMLAYSGRGAFTVRPLSLSKLAIEIGSLLEASVSKKAVLSYACDPDLPLIEGDAAQLHQLLINLITNASDAIGDKPGVITISTRSVHATGDYLSKTFVDDDLEEGSYVCLEVSDTGCGMDAATLARIFDPFFTTKFAGRGLGLSATLGIVRGHRGAITVYSEPGRGTTFKVLLPEVSQAGPGTREETEGQQDRVFAQWRGTGVILVADDEEVAREVARESFENHGFRVMLAVNGKEAVDKFRDHAEEISAVLLDLTMPVMGGEEAFREIQSIRSDVPIILSSGYTEQDVAKRFTGRGPAGFVQKPYAIAELTKKFHSLLNVASG